MLTKFPKPTVVFSRCLGFEACRHNGEFYRSPFVKQLRPFVDVITVCPEMEIGLEVPREQLRVETHTDGLLTVQRKTELDFTEKLKDHAEHFTGQLGDVDGFVMKSRSAACGFKDVNVYAGSAPVQAGHRVSSLLGDAIEQKYPFVPKEDDGRLTNFRIREHFLTWLFAHAELRHAKNKGTLHALIQYHARHKYQLMACSQQRSKALGHIVANHDGLPVEEVFDAYESSLADALSRVPRMSSNVTVLMHCMGHFSKELSGKERRFFLETLEDYKRKKTPLSVPVGILKSWILRFGEPYLETQSYFTPFPDELASVSDTGRGRGLRRR